MGIWVFFTLLYSVKYNLLIFSNNKTCRYKISLRVLHPEGLVRNLFGRFYRHILTKTLFYQSIRIIFLVPLNLSVETV